MDNWSEEERKKLERLIELESQLQEIAESDRRMQWLWASIRRLAAWITIVIGAIVLLWDNFKSFMIKVLGV